MHGVEDDDQLATPDEDFDDADEDFDDADEDFDDADEPETDDDVRDAAAAIRSGDPSLHDVMTLVYASSERDATLIGRPVGEAIFIRQAISRDLNNGGLDQVVWNLGARRARLAAATLREVGAIENADLLDKLAELRDAYATEADDEAVAADPVRHFLAYRRLGGGPFFDAPELDDELAEAVLEYVLAHPEHLPDPHAPLPPIRLRPTTGGDAGQPDAQ
jgi:hypothetical protein